MTQWKQVLYTSSDAPGDEVGGWGVKATSPALSSAEAAAMIVGSDTKFPGDASLGMLSDPATLRNRPRRLTARWEHGQLHLTHVAAAGPDATGRPGNAVVHVAVREGAGPLAIQYWRSEGWLTPFGPSQVVAAQLPEEVGTGESIGAHQTARFLSVPGRLNTVAVLLDALASDPNSGRCIVVLVDDSEEAAQWIAAVAQLRDSRFDDQLSWCTWARLGTLQELRRLGVRLMALPRIEADGLGDEPAAWRLVIDPQVPAVLADGEWHVGATRVPAGLASVALQQVSDKLGEFGAQLLTDLVNRVRESCASSSPDARDPLWALGAVVLADPDLELLDRSSVTAQVLFEAPQQRRPASMDVAVDRWWREHPDDALKMLATPDAATAGHVLGRRVALLLAGELEWDNAIDARRSIGPDIRFHLKGIIEKAAARRDALRERGAGQEEADRIDRVLTGYLDQRESAVPIGTSPAEPDSSRPSLTLAKEPHPDEIAGNRGNDASGPSGLTDLWMAAAKAALDHGDPASFELDPDMFADLEKLLAGRRQDESLIAKIAVHELSRWELLALIRAAVDRQSAPYSLLRLKGEAGFSPYLLLVRIIEEALGRAPSDCTWWRNAVTTRLDMGQTELACRIFSHARSEFEQTRRAGSMEGRHH